MNYASRIVRAAAAAVLIAGISGAAHAAPPGPPQGGPPVPHILLVDRNEVMSRSLAGQSIMKQVQGLVISAKASLNAHGAALQGEQRTLQQQLPILSGAVKDAKVKAFNAKRVAFQSDMEKQQGLIQGGLFVARNQVLAALKPILQKIMVERGGNILMERGAALEWIPAFDVTDLAIQRLNQSLPTVKVTPTPPPPQMQQQQ
jgi:Skp family chaperone for outer membrane proteins